MRTRLCDNPAPTHGGMDCIGSSLETRVCVRLPCCKIFISIKTELNTF